MADRPTIRRVFVIAMLIAAAGTGVLWGVSLRMRLSVDAPPTNRTWVVLGVAGGQVMLGWVRWTYPEYTTLREDFADIRTRARRDLADAMAPSSGWRFSSMREWHFGRFAFGWDEGSGVMTRFVAGLPLWAVLALFMLYPAVAFLRGPYRRYRRRVAGRCVRCGYDLTGNVSGVCPECGHTT
jgi:hypothetical protein